MYAYGTSLRTRYGAPACGGAGLAAALLFSATALHAQSGCPERTIAAYQVRLIVVETSGHPAPDVPVWLSRKGAIVFSAHTDAQGSVLLTPKPGLYALHAGGRDDAIATAQLKIKHFALFSKYAQPVWLILSRKRADNCPQIATSEAEFRTIMQNQYRQGSEEKNAAQK